MGFVPLQIPPGVVKSESDYAAQGRWIDTEHVRFVRGLPEKLGGVQAYIMPTFEGIARAALAWASYTGIPCLMWGTACHLHLWREGTLSEITPFRPDATGIALKRTQTRISARRAQAKESKVLEIPNMAPLLCVRTLNHRDGEINATEYSVSLTRADMIEFTMEH